MVRVSLAALLLSLVGCAAGVEDPLRMPGEGPSRAPPPKTFSAERMDPTVDSLRIVGGTADVAEEMQPIPRPLLGRASIDEELDQELDTR